MACFFRDAAHRPLRRLLASLIFFVPSFVLAHAQGWSTLAQHQFFIDCSSSIAGDGSQLHPWNSLASAQAHPFAPGDTIALARGTVCRSSFSPQGSGTENGRIRLTAYGQGPRPRIAASANDRQALLLFNQQYWQIDSLDISGGYTYGVFVSGDNGTLHHISLKNLFVHDVVGGEMKNKDNGLVVVGPSGLNAFFQDVLVDGVIAAHTNQWAGILIGGGNYAWKPDAPLNSRMIIRNSIVQDVMGDGIILFRDSDSVIETSTAWQTGMQTTQTIGTPNAIWTWTCTDCVVRDNEAFLTDSPGVDGGAYDIDWDNTRNTVERNYAHDTQGYCFAVFAAGYVTSESVVRDNLCIDNGLSPRLAPMQGAAYIYTWNGGVLRGVRIENNTFVWNPVVSTAPAIVVDADTGSAPISFTGNRVESSAPLFYRSNANLAPAQNNYIYSGSSKARFTLGDKKNVTFAALQASGIETGSRLASKSGKQTEKTAALPLRLDVTIDATIDADGLLASEPRAQLMVLRSLALQYGAELAVTAHLSRAQKPSAEILSNALLDLDAGVIHFAYDGHGADSIHLLSADGRMLEEWHGFQNAATLGGAVRARLGAPHYADMPATTVEERNP
jgi:Right handed beta helix region